MANMAQHRFENTYKDLLDCFKHIDDKDLSKSESTNRADLIELCKDLYETANDKSKKGD